MQLGSGDSATPGNCASRRERSTTEMIWLGSVSQLMLNHTQRRHCSGAPWCLPRMANCPFISWLLGITTVSQLRVSTSVARQLISTTRPDSSPDLIQSPTSTELSSCSDRPARILPSVSCIENASTPVITAEVVTMWLRSRPARRSSTSPQPTQPSTSRMSSRMRGGCRRSKGRNSRISIIAHSRISARPSTMMATCLTHSATACPS